MTIADFNGALELNPEPAVAKELQKYVQRFSNILLARQYNDFPADISAWYDSKYVEYMQDTATFALQNYNGP